MAYPTGSGSEILRRGTVNALTTTSTALLFNGVDNTALNQTDNVVPALHIVTLLNVTFCETGSVDESLYMWLTAAAGTTQWLLYEQDIPSTGTFVYSDKIVLIGGDKLIMATVSAANIDVAYCYIDQDWT